MKDAIIRFVEQRLEWARSYPKNADIYCFQAFGAVEFFMDNCEGKVDFEEIRKWWDTQRLEFWTIQQMGVTQNDEA